MMYKVIKSFFDLKENHAYSVGDSFPYRGTVCAERIEELSTENNRMREPLIAIVEDADAKQKRTRKKKNEE